MHHPRQGGQVFNSPPKRGWGEGEAWCSRSAGFQPASGQDGRAPRGRLTEDTTVSQRPGIRGEGLSTSPPWRGGRRPGWVPETAQCADPPRPFDKLRTGAPRHKEETCPPNSLNAGHVSSFPPKRGYRKKRPLFGLIRRERPMNGSDGRPAHILPDERGPARRQRIVNGAQYLIFPAHKSSKLPNDGSTSGGKRGGVFDFAVATLRPNGGG